MKSYYPLVFILFAFALFFLSCEKEEKPSVITTEVTSITYNSANSGGNVTSDGGATVTARGVCWSTSQNPTISDNFTSDGSGAGSFTSTITDLSSSTIYYVRAYATNIAGTAYGEQVSLTTISCFVEAGNITDYDGNVYRTITLGTQTWMAENLKVTHYRNGDAIPDGTGTGDISGEADPKYWFAYNDDLNNVSTYGRLYTWYTVTDSRNVCPDGWHVPSDAEWTTLETYLGGISVAGGKMKETGISHWISPNTEATNESGFSALPGGCRFDYGVFDVIGYGGLWWSATEYNAEITWIRMLGYYFSEVDRNNYGAKSWGLSVRCVRD